MKAPLLLCFLLLITISITAADNENKIKKNRLYIGVEKNHLPYAGLDKNKQASGILTDSLREVCDRIEVECKFITGDFNQLIEDLQFYKLNAVIVVDQIIFQKADKLILTKAFCKTQPVFIYSSHLPKDIKDSTLIGTTIGVQEGSLLHFDLIENYKRDVIIKPYHSIQAGLFDLLTQRIDKLATDKTFFISHLQTTSFSRYYATTPLSSNKIKKTASNHDKEVNSDKNIFRPTQMTLVLREEDTLLYKKINSAIQVKEKIPYCSDLFPLKD